MLMPSRVMRTTSSWPLVSFHVDEAVAGFDPDGDDAAFADVREIAEVRFLDRAAAGGEDDVQLVASRCVSLSVLSWPECG